MKKIALGAALAAATLLPSFAPAQATIHRVYTNTASVRMFVKDLERESNSFRHLYEQRYKAMFISDFRRSDEAERAIKSLDEAIEQLRGKAHYHKPQYARDEVRRVLARAQQVELLFRNPEQVLATMRAEWAALRNDIDDLAKLYEME